MLPNSARSSTNARMQTGRAAERPAAECRAKRMLKEPSVQRATEGPSSAPILPEHARVTATMRRHLRSRCGEGQPRERGDAGDSVDRLSTIRVKTAQQPTLILRTQAGGLQIGGVALPGEMVRYFGISTLCREEDFQQAWRWRIVRCLSRRHTLLRADAEQVREALGGGRQGPHEGEACGRGSTPS